jgi:flagellar biogenesis protein FliO
MDILQQLLAVAIVLGALCALIAVFKRKGWARVNLRRPHDPARRLEVIDRLVLTPHHSVHLIRLADRTLLIGLSPNGCNLLESTPAVGILPPGLER